MDIQRLLRAAVQFGASDLHIQAGSPPTVRVHGTMTAMNLPAVSPEQIRQLVVQAAEKPEVERIDAQRSGDFSLFIPEVARFRVNVFYEQGRLCLVARTIPLAIKSFEDLFLPPVLQEISEEPRGLVLVTGTTGSGKSTTLAAMIDYLNRNHRLRIITIEDPVEFVHTSQKSLIAQREIGRDTPSFAESLRRALRQDPDVILVGELRDLETMRVRHPGRRHRTSGFQHGPHHQRRADRAAVDRHVPHRGARTAPHTALHQSVGGHQPTPGQRKPGGRIAVLEVMRDMPIIRKLILEGRVSSLPPVIASRDSGMQLFDQHLAELYKAGEISGTEALRLATNPDAVALAMRGISSRDTSAGLVG